MLNRMSSHLAAVFAAASMVAFAPPVSAQTQIRLPIKVGAQTLRGKLMQQYGDEVAKQTHGRYKVTVYPGGQLYGGTSAAQAVQLGNVEMANPPNSAFTGYTKTVDLLEVPFAFPHPRNYQAFTDGPSGRALLKSLAKSGFEGLAIFDEGPFVIATKDRLLKKPADFKGELIRTSGHQVVVDALHAMGASTVKIEFKEVYSALQQGTIKGVYTTFDAYTKHKFYEQAPHVMLFPAHGAYIWVANKAWWDKQPAHDRAIMAKLARKLSAQYDHQVWADLKDYVATLKAHGGDYYDPGRSSHAMAAFRKAIEPAYAKLREEFGAETINALMKGKPIKLSQVK